MYKASQREMHFYLELRRLHEIRRHKNCPWIITSSLEMLVKFYILFHSDVNIDIWIDTK